MSPVATHRGSKIPIAVVACALASPLAQSADPAAAEVQRNQQMRQQQQDELQLRMQQHYRGVQTPPGDAHQQQAVRQMEIEQRQRLHDLHYRQNAGAPPAPSTDDEGTQRAKAQIEQQRAQEESRRQLQRSDWELQQRIEQHKGAPPPR